MARAWESTHPGGINTFSSPLYPWLLELLDPWMHVAPGFEGRVVMLSNVIALVLAAGAFYVFWSQSAASYILIGWGLFFWCCLEVMPIFDAPTDRLAAVIIFICAALLAMLRESPHSRWWIFPLLGWAAALGYFAKAGQFPMAFVFLGTALWIARKSARIAAIGGLLAVLAFASLAWPWIHAFHIARERWTFSDIGTFHYAQVVEGVPDGWVGDAVHGVSKEPYILLNEDPAIWAADAGSTSGYFWEPSRQFSGFRPRIVPVRQARVIVTNLLSLLRLSVVIVIFLWFARDCFRLRKIWDQGAHLAIPAGAAIAMYLLVHMEARYVSPYVVMLLAAIFLGLERPEVALDGSPMRAILVVACGLLALAAYHTVLYARHSETESRRAIAIHQAVKGLYDLGLKPGDRVSCLANTTVCRYVTLLAGLDNRAEADDTVERFFSPPTAQSNQALKQLERLGSKAVIVRFPAGAPPGWQPVGSLDLYLYRPRLVSL